MKPFLVALGSVAATLSPTLVPVAGAMRALDPTRTLKYTRYAAAAYCKGTLVENFECKSCTGLNGRFVTSLGNRLLDTSGYVAVDETDKRIILAFRGTRGLINQLTDVTAIPVPILGGPLGSLVHSGFKIAMKSMSSSFLPAIKNLLAFPPYADYRVAVVGHSMGGAIASLATVKLNYSLGLEWERMELYTYGQPRTGNFIFSRWLSQQPLGSARVVHHNDLVPHLAPGALSIYAHHQNEVWIQARNSLNAVLCRTSLLEEPRCSHSVPLTQLSKEDHSTYFRILVGQAGC